MGFYSDLMGFYSDSMEYQWDINGITLWLFNIAMENHNFLIGKPSINGPFSIAMLNCQRVYI